jgi:hypothetical protein
MGQTGGSRCLHFPPRAVYLQLWPTVFTRRAPNAVPAVERAFGGPIKCGQRITTITDDLLEALTSAYREATGSTST